VLAGSPGLTAAGTRAQKQLSHTEQTKFESDGTKLLNDIKVPHNAPSCLAQNCPRCHSQNFQSSSLKHVETAEKTGVAMNMQGTPRAQRPVAARLTERSHVRSFARETHAGHRKLRQEEASSR
jgi:hypothetical protein